MSEINVPTNDEILEGCKFVLSKNQSGDYTIPAEGLYPHQWLWDSCFIAVGLAEYDVPRAQKEIESLLRGQWSNGMLPHMIFAEGGKSSRDKNAWQSWRSPYAPDDVSTTGMTQPPVIAEAVVAIGSKMKMRERRSWYQDMYPALVAYHSWMYDDRDPKSEGSVLLLHPWECGLDNSPPWIQQLHQHSRPLWINVIDTLKLDKVVQLLRRDTHVPPGQRLRSIDALLYFSVLNRLKRKNWDTEKILTRSHFAIEDLSFNCILIRANEHLKDIAKTIGHELPEELLVSMDKSIEALDTHWDGFYKQYYSKAYVTNKLIKESSIATLLPLYAGCITKERATELVKLLQSPTQFAGDYPVPSVPLSSSWYKELGYWQGPTWINTNWMISEGLRNYGFDEEADKIDKASILAVGKHGPYEYFSAKTGEPAGAKNFSWTAALIIKMINKQKG